MSSSWRPAASLLFIWAPLEYVWKHRGVVCGSGIAVSLLVLWCFILFGSGFLIGQAYGGG